MRLWNFLKINVLLVILLPLLGASCNRPEPEPEPQPQPEAYAKGMYILNEGLFQLNNSTLSYYDFTTGTLTENIFLDVNHRGLGDVGNDLQRYGSKLYCVVNNSNIVEVMDFSTAKSLKTINLNGKQPRRLAFLDGKAYISCFDGDVVRVDTASLEIEATVHAGRNPDGICVCNGKLYVCNSGGLNYLNYDNTVSVFDLATFSLIKNITVNINPYHIAADSEGDVYVVSRGNYGDIPMTFQRIDSQTDEVVQTFDFPVYNFAISGNLCYLYSFNWSTYEYAVRVLDVTTEQIVKEQFIDDRTTFTCPYGIAVDPSNGDVYIADAYYNSTNGDVFCFGSDGCLKYKFEAGISPSCIVFK